MNSSSLLTRHVVYLDPFCLVFHFIFYFNATILTNPGWEPNPLTLRQ